MTFEDICLKVEKHEPFSFSRWGDGEWHCILGHQGQNCDGHKYFPDLGERLRNVLKSNPQYYVGMQPKAQRDMGYAINTWLKANNVNLNWIDADIFHNASIEGKFWPWFEKRYEHCHGVCLVGTIYLQPITPITITIPEHNAWLQYNRTLALCVDEVLSGTKTFLFCAGMMTKVLIDDLYQMFGDKITMLDFGSVLDPYFGIKSRRYHQQVIEREMKCPK